MKRGWPAIPVVAIVVLLFAFGFGRNPARVPDPLVRHAAPAFHLTSVGQHTYRLSQFRGVPLVLSFFASWCISCSLQESNLVTAQRRWRSRVKFLSVVFEDSGTDARTFARSRGAGWPDLVDPGGQVAVSYGVTGVPETFFIDKHGRIAAHSTSLAPAVLRSGIHQAIE